MSFFLIALLKASVLLSTEFFQVSEELYIIKAIAGAIKLKLAGKLD